MLERTHTHRGITITVRLNTLPGRRFRWSFETSSGLAGEGIGAFGLEAAFEDGRRAAVEAIDEALDG